MRIYVDLNTTNVYDAFSLGFEGAVERVLGYHRLLVANHTLQKVRENAEYFHSKVYETHLSAILLRGFGLFHNLIQSQLVCINTELYPVARPESDIVAKLLNTCAMDAVRVMTPFDTREELEFALFDEDTMEKLYGELEHFRDDLIRAVREEINDALRAALLCVE